MKALKNKSQSLSFMGLLASVVLLSRNLVFNKPVERVEIGLLFIIAIFYILLYLIERKNNYILHEIIGSVERIIEGNFNTRIYVVGNEEFSDLAKLLNDITDTFQKVEMDYKFSEESRRTLLSNISHDLRTPLTSIIGYLEALRDGIADSKEEEEEYIHILYFKALRLKHQVENIFYMAKLDADEIPMNFEVLNLSEVIRESVIDFMPKIQKDQINLTIDIKEEATKVYGDRLSILRIMSNLMENSLTHGKEGAVLGVELSSLLEEYRVCIWDKGPGISHEHIANVFDRLYMADRSRKNRSGSGLGLAIVKKLLEKHKGKIWVESKPFERTSFYFTIPKL